MYCLRRLEREKKNNNPNIKIHCFTANKSTHPLRNYTCKKDYLITHYNHFRFSPTYSIFIY